MSKAGQHTHAQLVTVESPINPGENLIGSFTLPAGGPWVIHDIYCSIVPIIAGPTISISGNFFLRPLTNDFSPHPTPSDFPFSAPGTGLGTETNLPTAPLNLHPVRWAANGKSQVEFIVSTTSAPSNSQIVTAGIIYSPQPPPLSRPSFSAHTDANIIAAGEQSIGTITLSESARRITGLYSSIGRILVPTQGESLVASIRLDSADSQLSPSSWPCNQIWGASPAPNVDTPNYAPAHFIPLDIPVSRGTRIDTFATLHTTQTTAAKLDIYIAYE